MIKGFKKSYIGIVLLSIGIVFSLDKYFDVSLEWGNIWPVVLVVIGLFMVVKKK